jgi:membrane protein YdbS with pleckstrin-like domain
LLSTLCSVFVLGYFGRRPLILLGNFSLGLVDIVIAVMFLILATINWTPAVYIALGFIMIFMIIYGLTIGPAVWLYVP